MPHLVILYTPNLEDEIAMPALCRKLCDAMLTVRDEAGRQVFPTGGTRVLAYPAQHFAVADGSGDHGFCWFNLRMGKGRSQAVLQQVGELLSHTAREHLEPVLARRHLGLTLQIDEGAEAVDVKFGNLHPLFNKT